ncbi:MAG: hypothetical protein RL642_66, partial [Bacteroidota bacterium]
MKDFKNLQEKINNLGSILTGCTEYSLCKGVINDPSNGIYPRCLYLETENRQINEIGCVVIGLNPGSIND